MGEDVLSCDADTNGDEQHTAALDGVNGLPLSGDAVNGLPLSGGTVNGLPLPGGTVNGLPLPDDVSGEDGDESSVLGERCCCSLRLCCWLR